MVTSLLDHIQICIFYISGERYEEIVDPRYVGHKSFMIFFIYTFVGFEWIRCEYHPTIYKPSSLLALYIGFLATPFVWVRWTRGGGARGVQVEMK